MPFHAETAREFLEEGITVQVVCKARDCIHWANLSMPSIIQRVGWDVEMWQVMPILAKHLVCSQCGAREPHVQRVRIGPSQTPRAIGGLNHSDLMQFDEATERSVELGRTAAARDAGGYHGSRRWRTFGKH